MAQTTQFDVMPSQLNFSPFVSVEGCVSLNMTHVTPIGNFKPTKKLEQLPKGRRKTQSVNLQQSAYKYNM